MRSTPLISLRWAGPADYAELADIMFDAVRNGPSKYNVGQRQAWVPERRSGDAWSRRLDAQNIITAEASGQLIGFMSLAPKGYLDFAYIRPGFQGRGVFRRLYREIETLASAQNQDRIWVHASLMAQPAFSKVGFDIVKQERVAIGEAALDRFEMEKTIKTPA